MATLRNFMIILRWYITRRPQADFPVGCSNFPHGRHHGAPPCSCKISSNLPRSPAFYQISFKWSFACTRSDFEIDANEFVSSEQLSILSFTMKANLCFPSISLPMIWVNSFRLCIFDHSSIYVGSSATHLQLHMIPRRGRMPYHMFGIPVTDDNVNLHDFTHLHSPCADLIRHQHCMDDQTRSS